MFNAFVEPVLLDNAAFIPRLQGVLTRWKRQFKKDGQQAFPGKGNLNPEAEELRRLKRECERLRRERDILGKQWPSSRRTPIDIRVHKRAPH